MTIVLLHAFPLDERMWAPQLEALGEYEVVAPRLYGRGASVESWADSVLAEVDGELTAVGASMGGYAALAMARRAPSRLRGLMLIGSRAGADSPERRQQRNEIARMLREQGVEAWYEDAGNPAPREQVLAQSAEDLATAMEVLRDRPDATDVVRSYPGPFVVAVGAQDELLPVDEARGIADQAPQGRLEVFPGAGHLVSIEQPEELNGVLLDFVDRAEAD